MKLQLRELRRIIRSVLLSEGVASPEGLAIYLGHKDEILLYDPAVFFESLGPYLDIYKGQKVLRLREGDLKDGLLLAARWSMVGGIQLSGRRPAHVELVAATGGYGPFLYDVAMALYGSIAPCEGVVSDDAKRIWRYYGARRGDVKVVPLPQSDTKEREDDPSIDIVVSGARPNWKPLQERHRAVAKELETRCKMMGLYVSGDTQSVVEGAFDEVGLRWVDEAVGVGRMG